MFFLLYRQKKDIDKIVDFYSPKQVIVWQRLQDAFKFRREITEITSWAWLNEVNERIENAFQDENCNLIGF